VAAARKVAVVALYFPVVASDSTVCALLPSPSLLRSFPVLVGVLPDDGGVVVVVVAPDGCYRGDEEGSGGGLIFASVSTVCALLPSPSLLRSFERCIHSLFSLFFTYFSPTLLVRLISVHVCFFYSAIL